MKIQQKLSVFTLCAAAATAFSPLVSAQVGTITFNGHVNDSGCTPTVNGANAGVVTLPQANVTDFPAVGDTEHWTPFTINVVGCNNSVSNVWAYFSQYNANASTGRLNNTGTATGIDLQLTNALEIPFNVWGSITTPTGPNLALNSGAIDLDYGVQYYRFATPSAGSVTSKVQYSLQFN